MTRSDALLREPLNYESFNKMPDTSQICYAVKLNTVIDQKVLRLTLLLMKECTLVGGKKSSHFFRHWCWVLTL